MSCQTLRLEPSVFYLTFRVLEPKMAARKKLLVATLGIVLLPASVFALTYTPTLSIAELFRRSSPPGPPKPYGEAIYDVYSGLLNEMRQHSLLERLIGPLPQEVLIRVETLSCCRVLCRIERNFRFL